MVSMEDILEASTNGVLRAPEARQAGLAKSIAEGLGAGHRGGVDIHIRAGGFPNGAHLELSRQIQEKGGGA